MKNAMKKLTSLLLVAVLLVGMIPFAASAAVGTVSVYIGTATIDCAYSDGVINPNDIAKVGEAIKGKNPAIVGWTYDGVSYNRLGEIRIGSTVAGSIDPIYAEATCNNSASCPASTHSASCPNQPCPNGCGVYVGQTGHNTTCSYYRCGCNGTASYAQGADHAESCGQYLCANCNLPLGSSNHWGTCKHSVVADKCSTPGCNASATASAATHATNCPSYKAPAAEQPDNGGNTSNGGNTNNDNTNNGGNTDTPSNTVVETWTVTFIDVNGNTVRTANVAKNGNISTDDLKLAAMSAGTKSGHSFYGWYYNNTTTAYTNDQLALIPVGGNLVLKAAFTQNANKLNNYQVYLHIYNNTMIGSPDKQLNITTGLALDGLVTMAEVKSLVMNYYTAKNSYGIGFDGLYPGVGNWALNYVLDQKYDQLSVVEADRTSDVVIKVMISNANAKNGKADSSNPKTGDSIYTAMTVMGLSAATLATVMYFYNKKRYTV